MDFARFLNKKLRKLANQKPEMTGKATLNQTITGSSRTTNSLGAAAKLA
jgi:hypothetical protein